MGQIRKTALGIIPRDRVFPLLLAVLWNFTVYGGARILAGNWYHYNIESTLDGLIPFWPPFCFIYLGCYLFWAVNYILIAKQEKEEVSQFFSADFLSRIVCLACFLLFPTTNTRPYVEPVGFWNQVMLFVYSVDAADNLFPSIHCLVSWLCYAGVRGKRSVPVWYQRASCVMAVLVCVSTVTTKQHVLVDVAGGVLLAEACLWIGRKPVIWRTYERLWDKVNEKMYRIRRERE